MLLIISEDTVVSSFNHYYCSWFNRDVPGKVKGQWNHAHLLSEFGHEVGHLSKSVYRNKR